ncbi:tetratricopeptide repeat protein [Rothia aeria]|uniref:Tetratricopeptide repeat protein n=1 Tax=Rothia aeria TaxID=172042 RepID=A0A7Z9A3F1_9MICC|nr:tetratricopeptide repeat protein [Rothia aeria]VEI23362.1 tetratricopeptide repeat protein [Rothia aeria]
MTEPNKPLEQMTVQERLDLGMSYFEEGRFDKAIKTWSNIRREEVDSKTYAQAQYNLGLAYYAQGEIEQAIAAWSRVHHNNDPKAYAWAQLSLGTAYYAQGELDQAIEAWSNIRRDDDSEAYAWVQFNLGVAYKDQGKLKQAIDAWSNVPQDDRKAYAWARFGIGVAYHTLGKLKQAIDAWSNVPQDDRKVYASAQFNLGNTYKNQGKLDQAITTWSNISHDDDPEIYARAQLGLGAAYKDQGELEQAIQTWSNITQDDDPEAYIEAQLCLGEVYSLDKEKEELAHEAYNNVRSFSYYKSEYGFKILKCPVEVRKELHSLAKNTDKVLKSLQIIPEFELKVAHYTRPQIAFELFEGKKNDNDKNPSNFRLNTIHGVNDPTEGLVLNDYWDQQGIPETIHTNDTATFISCFTFNHDSLNQFRLYGKENGREATGVSLVFKKEFFSDQSDDLKFIAGPSTDPSSKSEQDKSNETKKTESDNKKQLIGKSTLCRCIYLDPKTGYWTLAQRDKSIFYRENKGKAGKNWKKYYKLLSKKKKSVKKHLFAKNKSVLSTLQSIFKKYQGYSIQEKQYILEAIRFILLPLQYLVKHIAFQEEQECRIMYITQFRDEKIHSNREEQKMYVEYEESVLPHIDKIWLSPGAAKYQDFFRIRLDQGSGKSKVRISQNPFRNKE